VRTSLPPSESQQVEITSGVRVETDSGVGMVQS
jgi:hypothetical protein